MGSGQVAYIGVDARRTSRYIFHPKIFFNAIFAIIFLCGSTSNVKSMSIQRRNCLKQDETREDMEAVGIKLQFFSNYSRPSCLIECRAREIFEKCKCLPYYYPQFSNYWGVNTSCNSEGIECVFSKSGTLYAVMNLVTHCISCIKRALCTYQYICPFSLQQTDILSALDTGHKDETLVTGANCYCPIECEENIYIPEMSQARISNNSLVTQASV